MASIQRSFSDCKVDRRHRHGSQRVLWVLHTLLQPQGRRLQAQTALIPSGNQTHRRSTFLAQDPVVTSGKWRVPENTVWRGSSRSRLPRKKRCKVIPAALSLSASLSSPLSQSGSFSESLPDLVRRQHIGTQVMPDFPGFSDECPTSQETPWSRKFLVNQEGWPVHQHVTKTVLQSDLPNSCGSLGTYLPPPRPHALIGKWRLTIPQHWRGLKRYYMLREHTSAP